MLALRCILISDPRERRQALRLGVLPIVIVTSAHFLILRPLVLSGFGRTLAAGLETAWLKDASGMAAATIVPLEVERLAYRPVLWGGVATAAWILLVVVAGAEKFLPPADAYGFLRMLPRRAPSRGRHLDGARLRLSESF
ncbi:MAG TPA: hypothetical protein VFE84_05640 [Patescibacteria group bacterium]|nr:hypothetical protein [Patescibacteria group bacterium]